VSQPQPALVTELPPRRAESPGEDARRWLAENGVRRVRVGAFDLDGILRGKVVSLDKLLGALEGGFGFCDVVFGWDCADQLLDGLAVTGWHTGYPDALARIDPASRRLVPWDPGTAFFLADFWERGGGAPLAVCPRQTLKRVLARAEAAGLRVSAGFEYEFFFFRETPASLRAKRYRGLETLSPGMFGYSVLRAAEHAPLVNEIFDSLAAADLDLEGMHTETGPGVYECAIRYTGALAAADRAALFKTSVKEIARRHGLTACFMAKWSAELPGTSGHVHLSVCDEQGRNLFAAGPGLSAAAGHFTAGLLAGIAEFMPLVAPTVNSYKRLVPNTWAPTRAAWGIENRTAAVRGIPAGEKASRLEFRLPGADANPYLALAAAVALGHAGLEAQAAPPVPVAGNAYASGAPELPRSLAEAVERFAASDRARLALGDAFVDHFAATRRWEVELYRRAVTDWELARYFETA
jgi:glutamine synthetase